MININWSTLLLQILNFMIMVFILTKFFFKPVVKTLDERAKRVTSALDQAKAREEEAKKLRTEYDRKLLEANEQVLSMKQLAQEELEQTKSRFLEEAQQEIKQMRGKAEREIEQARQQAIHQHRRELGQLVTTLSARLIREAGGDTLQQAVIEEFIQRLQSLPVQEYRQEAYASEAYDVVPVELVSASALDIDSMQRIETQVQTLMDKAVEIKHKINPALIAGASIRFGDIMIDGSLEGHLEGLRTQYLHELEQG